MNNTEKLQNILIAEGATGTVLEKLLIEQLFKDNRAAVHSSIRNKEYSLSAYELLTAPLEHSDIIRELHKRYIAAGADIIKTATFSANLIDIDKINSHARSSEKIETFCYDLNRRAAELSSSCAQSFVSTPYDHSLSTKIIRTAGSIGPGTVLPALSQTDPNEIYRAYKPQVYGLIEGGIDILLIETMQDILHAKTILALVSEAQIICNKSIAIIVSATLSSNGTLLCGTELDAFAEIMAPYEPMAIGLNCSGGPLELEPLMKKLSRYTDIPLSIMPNAGLPIIQNGKTVWPMDPETWARRMFTIIYNTEITIAGGCCGTTPEHIAALTQLINKNKQQAISNAKQNHPEVHQETYQSSPKLASLYIVQKADQKPLIIDERANTQGSKNFKECILQKDLVSACNYLLTLSEDESNAIDIAISLPGKNEIELYKNIIKQVSSKIKQAIVIDSMSENVFTHTLPLLPGKALINSINLEDEARTKRLLALAKKHGAGVVLLTMDKKGPAKTAHEKIVIAEQLYELARLAGLRENDILFDTCTFPIISAGPESAQATLDAIRTLKERHPNCGYLLGAGNVSYGLARKLREPVTCYFYKQAVKAGLTAAIINPKTAKRTLTRDEELLLGNFFHKPDVQILLEYYESKNDVNRSEQAGEILEELREPAEGQTSHLLPPLPDLHTLIFRGKQHKIQEPEIQTILQKLTAQEKVETVLTAMQEVAQHFDRGKISLPEVMLAAETARAILSCNTNNEPGGYLATIVLATVKGDLHDIGKNMVRLVLEASNVHVIDLGIDVDAKKILQEAQRSNAHAIGISGLLTRSLSEIQEVANVMNKNKTSAVLICGGAAVSEEYVAQYIEPLYPGKVFYGKDPFETLVILKNLSNTRANIHNKTRPTRAVAKQDYAGAASSNENQQPSKALLLTEYAQSTVRTDTEASEKQLWSSSGTIPLHELLEALNFKRLIHTRLNYNNFAEGFKQIQKVLDMLQNTTIKLSYKSCICPCYSESAHAITFSLGVKTIELPVASANGASIAGYFQNKGGMFCCTLGRQSAEIVHSISAHNMSDCVTLHALFAELTETGAELIHTRIKTEAHAQGGKRYSFGFPGAPGVEYNSALLEFLSADTIGLSVMSSGELIPEYSITAIVSFDPNARYIDA
ncbi:MAG TPA: homocysteine S-methyltransferase family protein [Spirochaetales bacterium]|nr:homocysteine S-methyltransferase family protein [Spirochaetales bacterium]HQK33563.1 homocysteine S-methyltransferase family protein [Spirochaetales bacterium]